MKKRKLPVVFFNASVILAGLHTPSGGSGTLLDWAKKGRMTAVISELILDEVIRHTEKIGRAKSTTAKSIQSVFTRIFPPPPSKLIDAYNKIVVDYGDSHVLAGAYQSKAEFLVTLDKKHLLTLEKKVKEMQIVSPKQLIEILNKPASS